MHELDDHALLRQYAEQNSEAAFAALVTRHVDKVYSVALRHTRNAHAAEEITQAVFVILTRKANKLPQHAVLSGWLYETARLTALTFIRSEIRRARREQESHMQTALNENDSEVWPHIAPLLDDALAALSAADRHAIVLRYFDGKNLGEVAAAMGASEDAAKKRVTRAVEKLRGFFTKRGVTLTATILTAAISANSVQAAPLGLAATVTATATKGAMVVSGSTLSLVKGALKVMVWTKMQTVIAVTAGALLAATTGTGIYIHSHAQSPAKELETALLEIPPRIGTWSYPSDRVFRAILRFGSNRVDAFPILEKAVKGSNAEARKQAIAAMGLVAGSPRPQYGPFGEPATNAIPLLREILFANDESSSLALASLLGFFEPKDIPALASLLKQSHGYAKLRNTADVRSAAQAQRFSDRANANQQLQRYIPVAIAQTLENNSNATDAYMSSVEELLDDENADVRFGAACALAKIKGVANRKISAELTAGLKIQPDRRVLTPTGLKQLASTDGLKQLMAIELLQQIGPSAKPMLPALLEFANTTKEALMRELAFRAAGKIDEGLRRTMPEVDKAVLGESSFKPNPAK